MKGLLRYLSPFAPDQSGVVSVLYGMGGILVICDAGGCTGNICGFDEPRWFQGRSAIFSAGLRDMDAILGRDEALVEKLKDAADHLDASFAALIGTPVPAVIATDFEALKQMAKERTGLPVLAIPCTGTRLYDVGEQEAYLELFRTFAGKDTSQACNDHVKEETKTDLLGVIGCTPLNTSCINAAPALERYARGKGFSQACCYGMGAGIKELKCAGRVDKNLVLSPAGIRAAKYLEETFGTPFEIDYPLLSETFKEELSTLSKKRVLVIHQQVAAHAIRETISGGAPDENIVCGTWFMQEPDLAAHQDVTFEREDQFISFVESGNFEVIIGDPNLRRALRAWTGEYIECPHFAVSGILDENTTNQVQG
ncbi:MAG: nitrogenase component 1 [Lachnospiraceae bacterium]|nr:nitrogenase component 1 [Lachnospiraceae bacterium]